jgi:hypothetical protein
MHLDLRQRRIDQEIDPHRRRITSPCLPASNGTPGTILAHLGWTPSRGLSLKLDNARPMLAHQLRQRLFTVSDKSSHRRSGGLSRTARSSTRFVRFMRLAKRAAGRPKSPIPPPPPPDIRRRCTSVGDGGKRPLRSRRPGPGTPKTRLFRPPLTKRRGRIRPACCRKTASPPVTVD